MLIKLPAYGNTQIQDNLNIHINGTNKIDNHFSGVPQRAEKYYLVVSVGNSNENCVSVSVLCR